jgi:hypothetical protein
VALRRVLSDCISVVISGVVTTLLLSFPPLYPADSPDTPTLSGNGEKRKGWHEPRPKAILDVCCKVQGVSDQLARFL